MSISYTKDHEWIKLEGDIAIIGISTHAANALGDVVFVELPEVGTEFSLGDDAAVVESVKAASEVYAPVHGEITAINATLEDAPETVNEDPMGEGWFFKMKVDVDALPDDWMDEAAYTAFLETV